MNNSSIVHGGTSTNRAQRGVQRRMAPYVGITRCAARRSKTHDTNRYCGFQRLASFVGFSYLLHFVRIGEQIERSEAFKDGWLHT